MNPFAGEANTPSFLALNPNAKVPVIVDHDTGIDLFESNAILLYLADKSGRLCPSEGPPLWEALKWLFFQASSVGPMFGQRAHFALFAPEKIAYAIRRYETEADRLCQLIDARLQTRAWFLDDYSIVDIAHFGWTYCAVAQGFALDPYPALCAWHQRLLARPAVRRGLDALAALPDFSSFIAARRAFQA